MTQREQNLQSLEAQMHRAIRTGNRELTRRLARLIEANSEESWTEYHNRRFHEMLAIPADELI